MAVSWAETTMHQPGRPGVRGFGGRAMFFPERGDKPQKVEGSLTVYAFRENSDGTGSTKPDRKFVFTAEQLEKHYSPSKLGHSYSFWIPWSEVGGPEEQISLIARLEPKEGAVVVS